MQVFGNSSDIIFGKQLKNCRLKGFSGFSSKYVQMDPRQLPKMTKKYSI